MIEFLHLIRYRRREVGVCVPKRAGGDPGNKVQVFLMVYITGDRGERTTSRMPTSKEPEVNHDTAAVLDDTVKINRY